MNRIETVPADDLTLKEVNSGGSPRGGGSFRLSQAVAIEREETRKRLSRELLEGNNRNKTTNNDDYDDENDEDDEDYEEEEEDDEDEGGLFGMGPPVGGGMKMSLMDLLEETDRQAGIDGPTYRLGDGDEDEEEEVEEEDESEDDGNGEFCCCVCKVKHKGSAFIHCGHTYCRLCSKELCVEKGNCPLCNDFVVEVLYVL